MSDFRKKLKGGSKGPGTSGVPETQGRKPVSEPLDEPTRPGYINGSKDDGKAAVGDLAAGAPSVDTIARIPAFDSDGKAALVRLATDDPEGFVRFALAQCERIGVRDFAGFASETELKQVFKVAVEFDLHEKIFAQATAPAPSLPPQSRPTVRPPPPPKKRSMPPPPPQTKADTGPVYVAPDSEGVSGFEGTVEAQTGQRTASTRPPPPRPAGNMDVSSISDFLQDLRADVKRDVEESSEPTKTKCAFAHRYFDKAGEFLAQKSKALLGQYGQEALHGAEQSAIEKLNLGGRGQDVVLQPLEIIVLDLRKLRDYRNKTLAPLVAKWDGYDMEEEGVARNLANKSKTPSKVQQNPAPPSSAGAAPQSGTAPTTAAPAQSQKQEPKPPQASQQPGAPNAQQKKGWFRRFLSEYWMPTSIGIAAFSGAMVYRQGFKDMAAGISRLVEWASGRHVNTPQWLLATIYGGVMLSLVVISEFIIRRIRIRRQTEKLRARNTRRKEDKDKEELIIRKMQAILLEKYAKTEDLEAKIKEALRNDMELFSAMYSMRRDRMFEDILIEARVPEKIRGKIAQSMLPEAELEIMRRKLQQLANMLLDARERLNAFANKYSKDAIFHDICEELFATNFAGDYLNESRANSIFGYVENGEGQNVGPKLHDGLKEDYRVITAKK